MQMLYNVDIFYLYSHNATGVSGEFLIPLIYCRNLYTSSSVCGGHRFRASFHSKKKQTKSDFLLK